MAENDDQADLYWRSYFNAIMTNIGGLAPSSPNSPRAIMLAAEQSQAPTASRFIPMAITNAEVYNLAGFMQTEETAPMLAPLKLYEYVVLVRMYLANLSGEEGDDSEEARKLEKDAAEELEAAGDKFDAVFVKARQRWIDAGGADLKPFDLWVADRVPAFLIAQEAMETAKGNWLEAVARRSGPFGEELKEDRDRIRIVQRSGKSATAGDGRTAIGGVNPGFTMRCQSKQASSINDQVLAELQGQHPPDATEPLDKDCFFTAEYNLSSTYRTTLDDWAKDHDTTAFNTSTLSISSGSSRSWREAGHEEFSASAKVRARGLFRFAGGGGGGSTSSSKTWERSSSTITTEGMTFNLRWKKMAMFDVTPGTKWHIADVQNKYPKNWITEQMPPRNLKLLRVAQMLVATGLGLTVTFTGTSKNQWDEEYHKRSSSSGGAGFHIGVFGMSGSTSRTTSSDNETHTVDYDESKGELNINSSLGLGAVHLLGIVGERQTWFAGS